LEQKTFGRYRLLSVIGAGGMGKVYRAHDPALQRDVAIKVLPIELARDPDYRERFRRESLTAGRLNEQHIIPIHDVGEVDGHLFLVMPIIHGVDLSKLLQQSGPLSAQRAVRIIDQLAHALDAAHAAGLIHRDVKPSNALITDRDNAYLIDFGIAHDVADTRLTGSGFLMGTAAYMAPERFETGVTDARADVYALACVLYECLTATQPFPGSSMPQQMHAHLYTDPPRPSIQHTAVPAGFDDVVARGMAKNPALRYQTATELADAAELALRISASANTFQAATLGARARSTHTPHSGASTPFGMLPLATTHRVTGDRLSRRNVFVAAAAAVALIAVIAIAVAITRDGESSSNAAAGSTNAATSSSEAPPPPPPPVALGQLEQLLLSPAELNTIMGATDMTVAARRSTLEHESGVSPQDCLALASVADSDVYANSGWTDTRGQTLIGAPGNNGHAIIQNLVLFPATEQAQAFATASKRNWQACSNTRFTDATGQGMSYSSGPLDEPNGTLTVRVDSPTLSCQRALTAANNVVIDVAACGSRSSLIGRAAHIADEIAAKIPT